MTQPTNSIYCPEIEEDSRVLNVLQTVAIGVVMMLGVGFMAKSFGLSLPTTLLAGWLGGIAAMAIAVLGAFALSVLRSADSPAEIGVADLDALIGDWDDDLARDALCKVPAVRDPQEWRAAA